MKVAVIVCVALVVSALLGRRSAAVRHWVLSCAVACAAATPLLGLVAPRWQPGFGAGSLVQQVGQQMELLSSPSSSPADGSTPRSRPGAWPADTRRVAGALTMVWGAGSAVSLFVLVAGLWRLSRIAARSDRVRSGPWAGLAGEIAREYGVTRPVVVLESADPTLLVTWGAWRPKIVLPAAARTWSEARIRIVLRHELAHVRRHDWLIQMAAEVLRSAYWFNPLLWMACRCLRQESEQACDDEVLARGTQADAYASELVALARDFAARRRAWAPAPAVAHSSSLERRVRAMLNPLLNRTPLSRRLRFATATAMLAVAVPVAGFGPSPSPREPDASRESTAAAPRAEPSARNLPVAIVAAVTQAAPAEPATLSGTVRDQLGGLVPDVTIVLTMVDGRSRVATSRRSDQNGFFEFANLPPWDHYELRAQLPGFRTRTDVVRLPEGARVQWDLEMELGSIEETVTVVGGAAAPEPALDEGQLQRRRDFLRSQRDADPCAIAPAGGCVRPPVKIRHVNPYYPPELAAAGVEGVVLIEGVIGTNGFIATPSVRPGAHPGLEAAAVAAVTGWEFEPTRLGGVPVDTDITVTVSFDLNN